MFFDLIIGKFEHLKAILKSSLSCLCLRKVVSHFLIRECLFDVLVVEVDDSVAVWEALSLDAVVEDDFFLAIGVHSLNFSIMADGLLYDLGIGRCFGMVFFRVLETVVFFFCAFNISLEAVAHVNRLVVGSLLVVVLVAVVALIRGVLDFFFCNLIVSLGCRRRIEVVAILSLCVDTRNLRRLLAGGRCNSG